MKAFRLLGFSMILAGLSPCDAEEQPLPMAGVTAVTFSQDDGGKAIVTDTANLDHITKAAISEGKVVLSPDAKGFEWKLLAEDDFGSGRLDIFLNRNKIKADLAMVLNASLDEKSSVAIQLFDADNHPISLDLFGDIKSNTEAAGTDTFLIPLTKYPQATRLTLARLKGRLTVREILLMPVLSEKIRTEGEQNQASFLSGQLHDYHQQNGRPTKDSPLKIHRIPSLEEISEIGASALAAAGYPKYEPLTDEVFTRVEAASSGTVYDFAVAASRLISLRQGNPVFNWYFTSSDGVHASITSVPENDTSMKIGLASVPTPAAVKAEFFKSHRYHLVELPIARNAIEVLVNQNNPLTSLTNDHLKAAFGAYAPATTWQELGVRDPVFARQKVMVFAGNPNWGTSRVFQEIAMNGQPWRKDIAEYADIAYSSGVEEMVRTNEGGICYVSQHALNYPVKAVALEATDGSGPVTATEESIYSGRYPLQRKLYAVIPAKSLEDVSPAVRELINLILSDEGQTLMVRSGALPLAAEEVIEIRKRLGL